MGLTRRIARWAAAILYVAAGLLHFIKPEFYLKIVPPYFQRLETGIPR
jgi:uncharacterized membrane protein